MFFSPPTAVRMSRGCPECYRHTVVGHTATTSDGSGI